MTSKEVQEMINDIEDQIERFGIMNTMKLQLSVLKSYKQDLERLEALEKENKEIEELYLNENKHWCETIDSLRKENERLKKHNGRLTRKIQKLYDEHANLIGEASLLRRNNEALLKLIAGIEVINNE